MTLGGPQAQGRQSTTFRRERSPYLCWFGHGVRFDRRNHCGEEKEFLRFP